MLNVVLVHQQGRPLMRRAGARLRCAVFTGAVSADVWPWRVIKFVVPFETARLAAIVRAVRIQEDWYRRADKEKAR